MTSQVQAAAFAGRGKTRQASEFVLPEWLRSRILSVISSYFVIASLILFSFPVFDVAVSQLAFTGSKFVFAKNELVSTLRELHKSSIGWVVVAAIVSLGVYALWPKRLNLLAAHRAVYVLASFFIGALILVHSLKTLIGRARPSDTLLFGGDKDFTPAWQIADMCGASCSFPSGESAAAAAALSFIVYFSGKARWAFLAAVLPVALLLSANRILVGAHYLSDVVLAWLMVLFVLVGLWRYIEPRAKAIDARVRLAGEGARRFLYGRRAIA